MYRASPPWKARMAASTRLRVRGNVGVALVAMAVTGMAVMSCTGPAEAPPPQGANETLWDVAWSMATEEQREAMDDGVVTFAEYEAAALRVVQCIDEIGGDIHGEAPYNERTQRFELAARGRLASDPAEEERRTRETAACYEQYWNGINQAWGSQNQPTEQELHEARQAFAQCLRDAGVSVPDPASQEDFAGLEQQEAFVPCAERIGEEYGIPYFGG